jgi:hypothetical protein
MRDVRFREKMADVTVKEWILSETPKQVHHKLSFKC